MRAIRQPFRMKVKVSQIVEIFVFFGYHNSLDDEKVLFDKDTTDNACTDNIFNFSRLSLPLFLDLWYYYVTHQTAHSL